MHARCSVMQRAVALASKLQRAARAMRVGLRPHPSESGFRKSSSMRPASAQSAGSCRVRSASLQYLQCGGRESGQRGRHRSPGDVTGRARGHEHARGDAGERERGDISTLAPVPTRHPCAARLQATRHHALREVEVSNGRLTYGHMVSSVPHTTSVGCASALEGAPARPRSACSQYGRGSKQSNLR